MIDNISYYRIDGREPFIVVDGSKPFVIRETFVITCTKDFPVFDPNTQRGWKNNRMNYGKRDYY